MMLLSEDLSIIVTQLILVVFGKQTYASPFEISVASFMLSIVPQPPQRTRWQKHQAVLRPPTPR